MAASYVIPTLVHRIHRIAAYNFAVIVLELLSSKQFVDTYNFSNVFIIVICFIIKRNESKKQLTDHDQLSSVDITIITSTVYDNIYKAIWFILRFIYINYNNNYRSHYCNVLLNIKCNFVIVNVMGSVCAYSETLTCFEFIFPDWLIIISN